MPKQKRWTIKRELDQADGHLDLAINQLVITGSQYADVHDDYYEAFAAVIAMIGLSRNALSSLKDKI